MAVVHVSTAATARQAIEAGADGLIHLFTDRAVDPDLARLAAERKAFVIPTLTVLESTNGVPSGRSLTEDSRVRGVPDAGRGREPPQVVPGKDRGRDARGL